ncbi:hypothetical protein MRB53_005871 [Persea americana]|uniref:Uncharacterized protein n=1 Tax=Persea americana TaxID=3435 RepID=A0ACC2MEU4_PERAE|nr:hypothetical protein MRB53_005871 [Persea americana]
MGKEREVAQVGSMVTGGGAGGAGGDGDGAGMVGQLGDSEAAGSLDEGVENERDERKGGAVVLCGVEMRREVGLVT